MVLLLLNTEEKKKKKIHFQTITSEKVCHKKTMRETSYVWIII